MLSKNINFFSNYLLVFRNLVLKSQISPFQFPKFSALLIAFCSLSLLPDSATCVGVEFKKVSPSSGWEIFRRILTKCCFLVKDFELVSVGDLLLLFNKFAVFDKFAIFGKIIQSFENFFWWMEFWQNVMRSPPVWRPTKLATIFVLIFAPSLCRCVLDVGALH